ncbi:hypothetical protein ES708_05741 [subsurface metagenome]
MKIARTKAKSNFILRTNIKVTVFDLQGNVKDVTEFHNLIMTVGKNMFRDALYGAVTDLEIKRLGIGGTNTAPAVGQTTLVSEFFRKAITIQVPRETGILKSTTYIAPYEANTPKIEELGWFAGVLATDTKDSGIMISRVLYSKQKTELESLNIERTDTISEVV